MAHLKVNKFLLILHSPENPVWAKLLTSPKSASIHAVTGVSASTLSNWRRGGTPAEGAEERIIAHMRVREDAPLPKQSKLNEGAKGSREDIEKAIKAAQEARAKVREQLLDPTGEALSKFADRMEEFLRPVPKPNSHDVTHKADSLIEIAAFFDDMDPNACRKIIDEAIYLVYPVFPSMYYAGTTEGAARAEAHLRQIRGSYSVYLKREEDGKPIWIYADIRVRYTLKIGDGLIIRCKMNFPSLNKITFGTDSWEYDGVLVMQEAGLFWFFEMREPANADYIHFVTKSPVILEGKRHFAGTYLTTGQDSGRSIVSGEIVLKEAEHDLDKINLGGKKKESKSQRGSVIGEPNEVSELLALHSRLSKR